MGNDILSQVLGSALGGAGRGSAGGSPLGGLLGGLLGGGRGNPTGGGLEDLGGMGGMGGMGSPGARAQAGGGLGGLGGLGGMLGGAGGRGGGRNALLLMLLPVAMQWVQRNGGLGALLQRFQQAGHGPKVQSWVGTGDNDAVDAGSVREVVGQEELSRLSQQLDVGEDEVASGLADIFPEMVNQLTPAGEVPQDADDRLATGTGWLEQWTRQEGAPR